MKRSAIIRKTPIRKQNRKRMKKRADEGLVYGPYHDWIGKQACILASLHSCGRVVVGHHLKSVGSGGVDRGNEVPMCTQAHLFGPRAIHTIGPVLFEECWKVNLTELAAHYETRWLMEIE